MRRFAQFLLGLAALLSLPLARAQQYGLSSRPAFTAYNNGVLPTTAPTFSGSWSAVPAFPNVTLVNVLGVTELPGQAANARRMVAWEREGRVYSFPKSAAAVNGDKLLLLDISAKCQGWDDSGLLGLAFHPNFGSGPTNNRFVFLYYTWVPPGTVQGSATVRPPTFKPCHDRLSRFTVNTDGTINPASETIFIDQVSASVWHNGGGLFFHPGNGFLYLTNGDDADSGTNTQRIDRGLYSGVFRIDVDQRGGTVSHPIPRQPLPVGSLTQNYYIPNDNPFVGQAGVLEEFFCIGLRSPHRMTVDPVSQRIFIGDVGLSSWEEVDIIEPNESGLNFQWALIEGLNGDLTPPYIGVNKRPVINFSHSEGNAVIGGYVYRGSQFANDLGGKYLFADNGFGTIWYLNEATDPPSKVALCALPNGPGPESGSNYTGLSSFGVDADGEIYLCQMSSVGGRIYTLQRGGTAPPAIPATLSASGLFSSLATLTPAAGFTGYDVNTPLWSDRAVKTRWMAVPSTNTISYAPTGEWTFPQGTVFLKHFELPTDDNNPATHRRLETRVLVRNDSGYVYGMTYKWRADNSDADLVTGGITENVPITGSVNLGTPVSTDIGAPTAGSTQSFNGGFAVTGGGSDIYGTADQFRFHWTQKTGDFDIATRIESLDATDLYTKAGLMARESLAANSRNVMALIFPTNAARSNNTGGYEFQYRDTTAGTSASIYPSSPQPAQRLPNAWLRLQRSGNIFNAFYSRDGTNWTPYATHTLALSATVYFGMAVTAHNATSLATARFNFNMDRVQPWYFPGRQDCLACHSTVSGGVLGVKTRQSNRDHLFTETGVNDNQLRAWNHAGYFSPAINEATISSLTKLFSISDTTATVEQRMRSYLDSNCSHCHRPGGVPAFWDARFETTLSQSGIVNGIVSNNLGVSNAKVVAPQDVDRSLMYRRMGTATANYKMPTLAKNLVDQNAMALLEQWIASVVQPPADPLPAPWNHSDIGSVGFAGDATYLTGSQTFIMSASGDDIWNAADAFHFAYQPLTGDGEIIARVQSFTPTDPYTKAGVMIRDTLAAGSKEALLTLTSANGAQFQYRAATGGQSFFTPGPNVSAPYFVRIRRQGDVITGYIAGSAGAWQQVGTVTLPMGANIYIGLALTAHNNTQTATALFDTVSVSPSGLPLELHVNFQPADSPIPDGYLPDAGDVFADRGNGFSYGWDAISTQNARDRNNAASPDQRYDTLIHMQKAAPDGPRTWEVAVPNGTYSVHAVSGDTGQTDSHHVIAAEGVTILDGIPTANTPFIEATASVTVGDGRLTLSPGAGGSNTKINYVDIVAVTGAVQAALTSPAHESAFYSATPSVNFSSTATTTNSGATITKVEYFNGFTKLGEATVAPFAFTWSSVPTGIYHVMAKATESTGAIGFSVFNDITVSTNGPLGFIGEYWPNITMSGTPITRNDANIQFDWALGTPMPGIPNDNFTVRWRGRIKPQFSETYTFTTATDDGVRLWVGGLLIIDKWVNQAASPANTGITTLVAGQTYDIEMQYYENFGTASAKLYWSSTSQALQTVPATALFNPLANTNHRPRQPDILIPTVDGELADPGVILMSSGAFQDVDAADTHAGTDWEIWTTAATPARVWNALNQTGAGLTTMTLAGGVFEGSLAGATQLLNSTNYQLRVRQKDSSGDVNTQWSPYAVRLFTTTPPDAPRGVFGEYYPNTQHLDGTPLTRTDANVNFDWGTGAPFTGVGVDNFSVRWRARVKPQFSETYTFTTETDDGARLWVNGVQLVDKWVGQSATQWSGTITLFAGQYYDLEMQYFDGQFGASAKLYWSSASQPQQIIPALRLYAIAAGANHRPLVPIVTGPATDDSFLDAATGALATTAFADQDAANTHLATDWEIWTNDATPTRIWSALNATGAQRTSVPLGAGTFENSHTGRTTLIGELLYKIRARHRDSSGDANSEWSAWSDWRYTIASASDLPHGLAGEYYPNTQSFEGVPLQRVDPNVDFTWTGGGPIAGVGGDNFTARWRARVKPEFTETYTFKTVSDDGARLYVNGQLLIDQFVYGGNLQFTGTITLQAGQFYDIELHYLQGGFDAYVHLLWSSASRPEQVIPGARLYLPATGANHRPRSPDIVTPTGTGFEHAIAIAMQSGAFSDLDAAQSHLATDWEIWTTAGTPGRVWRALNLGGTQRLNMTLSGGVFENALVGQTRLNWDTAYQLRIRHRDSSGDALSEWSPYSTRNFTTMTAPFTTWRNANFTAGELADNAISGANADPDHDGLVNLLEHAFRLPPKAASVSPVQISSLAADAIFVTYPQNVDATDVFLSVQQTTNLTTWDSVGVTYELLGVANGVQTIRARVPRALGPNAKQFVRVMAVQP